MIITDIIITATRQVLSRLHNAAAPALVNQCTSPTGKVILVPVLAALGLCLGACTDEPSENEMADAVNRAVSQVYDAAYARNRPIPGPMPVLGLRKIDCDKAKPKPGYVCNFEPFVNGTAKPQEAGRFYKGTDGIMTYSQF